MTTMDQARDIIRRTWEVSGEKVHLTFARNESLVLRRP